MSEQKPGEKRRIRSFVRRQGRITRGQERALQDYWQDYGLELDGQPLDFAQVFGRRAPVILEIGFGDGKTLFTMAGNAPEKDFVGVEVHRPGVGSLINDASAAGLGNIRVFCEDAIEVLNRAIADNSLSGVQLFFPDPWHKQRHQKRRIVQPDFVALIRRKLVMGGYFHMATDWENYARHMLQVMTVSEGFENQAGAGNYSTRPEYRPETRFERRGLRLGHGVWDLVFIKA